MEELAAILNQSVQDVSTALSVACRLGFATRVDPPSGGVGVAGSSAGNLTQFDDLLSGGGPSSAAGNRAANPSPSLLFRDDGGEGGEGGVGQQGAGGGDGGSQALAAQLAGGAQAAGASPGQGLGMRLDNRAVAVVLDAEATSFLMMGALSPGAFLTTAPARFPHDQHSAQRVRPEGMRRVVGGGNRAQVSSGTP